MMIYILNVQISYNKKQGRWTKARGSVKTDPPDAQVPIRVAELAHRLLNAGAAIVLADSIARGSGMRLRKALRRVRRRARKHLKLMGAFGARR